MHCKDENTYKISDYKHSRDQTSLGIVWGGNIRVDVMVRIGLNGLGTESDGRVV